MKKIIAIVVGIAFIASLGTIASAQSGTITDPTGDVMHYRWHDDGYGWSMNIANKPNIDITEVKYVVTGDTISLSLTVAGTIVNSEEMIYSAYLLTSDSSYNFMYPFGGEGYGIATSTVEGDFQFSAADITVSGNTITATYDVVGTFSTVDEFYGYAQEYTVIGDTSSEWWVDWAPNEESPYQPTDPSDPIDPSDPTGETSGSITDPANDVYIPGGQTGISNMQYLDIRKITYTFDDNGLTLTMELQGTVSNSDGVTYTVTLDTEDASYVMMYDWGEWSSAATSEAQEFIPYSAEDGAASGNTITVLFDTVGSSTTAVDFWGQALELGGARDDVPNENGGTTTPSGNGTPGFELLAVLAALGIALILIKKRK